MAKKKKATLKEIGEWGLIDWVQKNMPVNASGLVKGIGDDAAVLIGGEIITSDMLVERVHFDLKWQDLTKLGRKAMAVNLSDIAGMGGFARCAFLNIAAPPRMGWNEVEQVLTGFSQACREYGVAVAGGDTCASPGPLIISVTVVGNTPRPVMRSGARPGDLVFVTGTLGDAALALKLFHKSKGKSLPGGQNFNVLQANLLDPKPRMKLGRAVGQYASSMIDLSDGLAADIAHICRESSVGVKIKMENLPLSEEYKFIKGRLKEKGANKLYDEALYGGEDYELLFTLSSNMVENIFRINTNTDITEIGEITEAAQGMLIEGPGGEIELDPSKGYKHF